MNTLMRYRYVLYIIALLPIFIFRDYTPNNELKYISIVDEALRNGTWFTFWNHGAIYADKPPLYFWMMMIARLVTGEYHMWLMGLFSLIPAAGTMIVMDRWMRLENVRHNALISNLLLGTTVIFLGAAIVLRMDMLMTFFIVLTLYTFFKLYKDLGRPRDRWLLPVWLFLAIFSKGPMGILIPLVSVVAFLLIRRQLRQIGRWFGWRQLLILLGLCGAWFGAIYLEGGSEYLNNILFKQTVGRAVDSFHHDEHMFWYFPRMLYTFAPWTLVYLVTIWLGVRRHLLLTDTEKFLYTAIWTNIIMLSLVSSKIDIYMLPIYPFVAYLSSAMLSRTGGGRAVKFGVLIPAVVFAVLWPASFFADKLLPIRIEDLLIIRIGLGFASLGGLFAILSLWRNRIGQAIWYIGTGMLAMLFTAAFSIPQFDDEIGFRAMAERAEQTAAENDAQGYAFYRYSAFSDMDVFLGRQLERIESVPQLDSLDALPGASVLFLRQREVRRDEALRAWVEARPEAGRINKDFFWLVVGAHPKDAAPETESPTVE